MLFLSGAPGVPLPPSSATAATARSAESKRKLALVMVGFIEWFLRGGGADA
jgi:hypothetical protein